MLIVLSFYYVILSFLSFTAYINKPVSNFYLPGQQNCMSLEFLVSEEVFVKGFPNEISDIRA